MDCRYCSSNHIKTFKNKTNLGYLQYFCKDCCHQYNERTGTKFNFIEFPNEVVMLAVYCYYKFKVDLDNVVELMALRGIYISHQTVHNWVQIFGVDLGIKLREHRKGKVSKKWHVDATYVKIVGNWCYLNRAIDREGNLVDAYLSDTRGQKAAENFFKQALVTTT